MDEVSATNRPQILKIKTKEDLSGFAGEDWLGNGLYGVKARREEKDSFVAVGDSVPCHTVQRVPSIDNR